jgi:uncharacterized protein (TIGR02246 family)
MYTTGRNRSLASVRALLGALLAATTISCTHSGGKTLDITTVRSAVDSGNAGWIDAFRKSDGKALSQLFTEDGAMLQSSGEHRRGREAIQKAIQSGMDKMGSTETTIDTDGLWLVDNMAYETGRYSYTYTPKGKDEVRDQGRYVVIWKRQPDDTWKIHVDLGLPDH